MPDWVDQSVAEQEEFLRDAIEAVRRRNREAGRPSGPARSTGAEDGGVSLAGASGRPYGRPSGAPNEAGRTRAGEAAERGGPEGRDCFDCGQPIPKKRLALVPGARRCVKCAESFERKRGRAT